MFRGSRISGSHKPPSNPAVESTHSTAPVAMLKRTWDAAMQSMEGLSPRKIQPYPSPGGPVGPRGFMSFPARHGGPKMVYVMENPI